MDCGGTTPLWLRRWKTNAKDLALHLLFTVKPKRRHVSALQK